MSVQSTDPRASQAKPAVASVAKSPVLRYLFGAAGFICLGLGIIGVFVPVMPTTPFILLAAACFLRSSTRMHEWLLRTQLFGPIIVEWQQHRSIPYRTKVFAVVLMLTTLFTSVVLFVQPLALQLAIGAIGIATSIWIWRIPSRDRPRS